MPKEIKCNPDWDVELIKKATKKGVESFLGSLRGKRLFKFIGKQSTVEDIASNIFKITSGKQFNGLFQIIDDPSGTKLLKIEYEQSGKKTKSYLGVSIWDNIFEVLEESLAKSVDEFF